MEAIDSARAAQPLEREYRWQEAAKLYEQLVTRVGSSEERASLLGRSAYALFRSAFQVDSAEEYRRLITDSARAAEDASASFRAVGQEGLQAYYLGWKQYALSFLASDRKQAVSIIEDAIRLFDQASIILGKENNKTWQAESLTMWLEAASWGSLFADQPGLIPQVLEAGEERAGRALKLAEESGSATTGARVRTWLGRLNFDAAFVLAESREQVSERAMQLVREALELSEHGVDAYTRFWATDLMARLESVFTRSGLDTGWELFNKALSDAERMRDNRLICQSIYGLIYILRWQLVTVEDLEKAQEIFEQVQRYASRSEKPARATDSAWTALARTNQLANLLQVHRLLAEMTPDPLERRRLLEPAIRNALNGMDISDHRFLRSYLAYALSTAYASLAIAEPSKPRKREILNEAVKYAELQVLNQQQTEPAFYWNIGIGQTALGSALYELSAEEEAKNRGELLRGAAAQFEEGLATCVQEPSLNSAMYLRLGRAAELYAKVAEELRAMQDVSPPRRSVPEILQQAIEFYQKSGQQSRIAEGYWKIALQFDASEQFSKSLDAYGRASDAYGRAAQSIPVLAKTYGDYAVYMQGWKAVTTARIAHEDENYGEAEQRYLEAAETFGRTAQWSHLKPHYSACALLERAENYSKLEQSESCLNTLREASVAYEVAHSELLSQRDLARSDEQRMELEKWTRLTESRGRYSSARAAIEEAKLLDQSGQRAASARKFQEASDLLEKLVHETDLPSASADLNAMIILCKAWAEMKRGESEQSSQRFESASNLFIQAKETTRKEKAGLLALGNASLCLALALGTQFISNFNDELFVRAKKHLETAANHYLAAGYTKAASWVRATERLFDAFVYLGRAEMEVDAAKRVDLYGSAEKFLQSAKTLFSAAGYLGKQEEAERYLTRAREERELLLQPSSIPGAASFSATASQLTAPALTRDHAMGLERFEGSSLLANLVLSSHEGRVGDRVEFELEIVNVGRVSAILVKVEHAVPERCELVGIPEPYKLEGNALKLKGKKLDPFHTEEIKLTLKLKEKGSVKMSPKIYYLDERGTYQSHQAEPAELEIRELGIGGWFRGPTKLGSQPSPHER